MKISRKNSIIIALFAFVALSLGGVFWLTLPYGFSPQRRVATTFITYVNAGEFEKAFELTQKNMYTGKTLEAFKNKALREIRGPGYLFAYAYPPQTNGNRLRHRFRGAEIEMPDVSLEFRGPSDLRITVRHEGDNQWKVSYITTHAG